MLLPAQTRFLYLLLIVLSALAVSAQEPLGNSNNGNKTSQTNYEIRLQLLVTSTAAQTDKLPINLAKVERQLKSEFGNVNLQLAMTLFNRASDGGALEAKGISPLAQSVLDDKSAHAYEFSMLGFEANAPKTNELLIRQLRFGMRVPITGLTVAQDSKNYPIVNYEQVGITARQLSIAFNEPTIIGMLTTSRSGELIVLVLTIIPDDASPN